MSYIEIKSDIVKELCDKCIAIILSERLEYKKLYEKEIDTYKNLGWLNKLFSFKPDECLLNKNYVKYLYYGEKSLKTAEILLNTCKYSDIIMISANDLYDIS